ncbi:hypothetical protein CPBF424_35150 [Xanthomonas euroxanthea]|uniref:Uncharacterized protein n=1 Tax=Xanthomonas euroxanthea TaxID=2259622 RepID=A0AA46CAS8_9XANT|nr:hypothetical protein CPBF424_35150 [Xanthomonas euroxanthea]
MGAPMYCGNAGDWLRDERVREVIAARKHPSPAGEGGAQRRMRVRATPGNQYGAMASPPHPQPNPALRPGLRQRRRRTKARAPVARKLCRGAPAEEGLGHTHA